MITRSPVKPSRPPGSGAPGLARRAPTPQRSATTATATTSILTSSTATGSTATPHEAMVASQLAHINDLVQKNRSLEQTIKRLNDDISKSAADVLSLNNERKSWEADRNTWMGERQKWKDERKAWTEGCDMMQALHRIQQYRVACALHDERVTVLKMQEEARNEQLKRLQRDYKITMFQAREAELEEQIGQLEELRDEAVKEKAQYEKISQESKARSAALADEIKSKVAEIKAAHTRCEQAEDDLRHLREAHADAMAASTATSSKLTRLTTERNALDAQVTSLKRSLEVAEDETTQLRSQLALLQSLKKGEAADAEKRGKKMAELQQELEEAKGRISELETRAQEADAHEAKCQKYKERIARFKTVLEEWQTEVKGQTEAREAAEAQLADGEVRIASLEQKVVELEAQLSVASKPKSSGKKPAPPNPTEPDGEPDRHSSPSTSNLPAKVKDKPSKPASTSKPSSSRPTDAPAKPRPKPCLVKKPDPVEIDRDSDIEIVEAPSAQQAAPERSEKARGKQKANAGGGSDIEIGEVENHKKGKTKDADRDVVTKEPTKVKSAKRKKTSPSDEEEPSKTKAKTNSKKRASPDPNPPKKSKTNPSQPKEAAEDVTDAAPKKKKRKINLFGGSQPSTFDWNAAMPQTEEELGIPRQLSPMKETDVVPRRLGADQRRGKFA